VQQIAHGGIAPGPISDCANSSHSPTDGASSAPVVASSPPRPEVEPPAPVVAVSPDYVARAVARRRNRPQRTPTTNGEVEGDDTAEQLKGAAPHEVPALRSSASSVKADSSGRLVKGRSRAQVARGNGPNSHVANDGKAALALASRTGRKQKHHNPLDNR